MLLSWAEIHILEVAEAYPAVLDALEARLHEAPDDAEAVIRLGFNLWYAVVENQRMGQGLPTPLYAQRFMQLFQQYHARLQDNADFCWAFGLAMHMFPWEFPGATEERGQALLDRAGALDPFWRDFWTLPAKARGERLQGRGIFAAYYQRCMSEAE